MELALMIGLTASVVLLLITIRIYEKRIEQMQADRNWAIERRAARLRHPSVRGQR
jgi:hypothetical protein